MTKQAPELLTPEEMERLIAVSSKKEFYFMLFNVARVTGRRLGELYGVERKEVIGEKESGRRTKDGKPIMMKVYKNTNNYEYGVKVKDIIKEEDKSSTMKVWVLKRRNYIQDETTLPEHVSDIVWRYINKHKLKTDDYLFRAKSYRQIQSAISKFGIKAGIKKRVMFHSFRHYMITYFLKKGWNYNEIAKLTGHKSINSLSSYDHVVSRDLRERTIKDLEDMK